MPDSKRRSSKAGSASQRHEDRSATPSQKQKRQITIYDAVAGRVASDGFIPEQPRVSKYRDTISSSSIAVPPEEALFRRRGAPERYEEDDIYWADRHLTAEQRLPDSDLLKAIHTYASDFYGRATTNGGHLDFESLDETALLGIGILLEEMTGHALGETGDLAFVEGEEVDEVNSGLEQNAQSRTGVVVQSSGTASAAPTSNEASDVGVRKMHKRRKVAHFSDDVG